MNNLPSTRRNPQIKSFLQAVSYLIPFSLWHVLAINDSLGSPPVLPSTASAPAGVSALFLCWNSPESCIPTQSALFSCPISIYQTKLPITLCSCHNIHCMSKLERNPSGAKKSVQFLEAPDNPTHKTWQNPQMTKFCILVFNQNSTLAKPSCVSSCLQQGKSKPTTLFWRSPPKPDPACHTWNIPRR